MPRRFASCGTGRRSTRCSGPRASPACATDSTGEARRLVRRAPAAPCAGGVVRADRRGGHLRLADGHQRLQARRGLPLSPEDGEALDDWLGRGGSVGGRGAAPQGLVVVGQRWKPSVSGLVRAPGGGGRNALANASRGRV